MNNTITERIARKLAGEHRFIVFEQNTKTWDTEVTAFESLEKANDHAWGCWVHLTRSEQKYHLVEVGIADRSDLMDEAIDEDDGIIDWELVSTYDHDDTMFNSAKYERELIPDERCDEEEEEDAE